MVSRFALLAVVACASAPAHAEGPPPTQRRSIGLGPVDACFGRAQLASRIRAEVPEVEIRDGAAGDLSVEVRPVGRVLEVRLRRAPAPGDGAVSDERRRVPRSSECEVVLDAVALIVARAALPVGGAGSPNGGRAAPSAPATLPSAPFAPAPPGGPTPPAPMAERASPAPVRASTEGTARNPSTRAPIPEAAHPATARRSRAPSAAPARPRPGDGSSARPVPAPSAPGPDRAATPATPAPAAPPPAEAPHPPSPPPAEAPHPPSPPPPARPANPPESPAEPPTAPAAPTASAAPATPTPQAATPTAPARRPPTPPRLQLGAALRLAVPLDGSAGAPAVTVGGSAEVAVRVRRIVGAIDAGVDAVQQPSASPAVVSLRRIPLSLRIGYEQPVRTGALRFTVGVLVELWSASSSMIAHPASALVAHPGALTTLAWHYSPIRWIDLFAEVRFEYVAASERFSILGIGQVAVTPSYWLALATGVSLNLF